MLDPPLVRLVPVVEPLPRRTALVPELPDDVDVDPPPRGDALDPEEDEPLDDELEVVEPEELDPDDPLEGGADRTGCCSEYAGAEYDGAEYAGAEYTGDDSRGTACVVLELGGAGGGAVSVAGGADRGIA